MRWLVYIIICLGLLFEAPGTFASSKKKKPVSAQTNTSTISYTWQEGDTLSSALYSIGIGHSDKTKARLYGNQGWVAKNLSYSQKTIGEWEQVTPGTSVTLWVPTKWPGAILTPSLTLVVTKASPTTKATERKKEESKPSLPSTSVEIEPLKKMVQKAATDHKFSELRDQKTELSAKKAPLLNPSHEPYFMQRPVYYQETMDSLIFLSSTEPLNILRPHPKGKHLLTLNKSQQDHLEKSEEGLGILAIIIVITLFSFGIYSLQFQRKYRNYKRMRQSANAYLARLIGAEDTMPEQSSLFEIMALNTEDLSKSWASYEVLGYYHADCILLSTIKTSWLDAATKSFPYPPLPPDQFACFARFIIVSPQILVQILSLASSVALQRAALRQLVAHMMEIPPDSQKKSTLSAGLQDFLVSIPKSREKLPLRDDVKKCIHWIEKLPSEQPPSSTQVA